MDFYKFLYSYFFFFLVFCLAQVDSLNFLLLLFWFIILFSFFYFAVFVKIIPGILVNLWVRFFFFESKVKTNFFIKNYLNLFFLLQNKNFKLYLFFFL